MALLKKGDKYKPTFLNKFTFKCPKCDNVEIVESESYLSPELKKCSKCQSKMFIASWNSDTPTKTSTKKD